MNKPFKAPKSEWSVAEAKARFSEVIEKAALEGPQAVTRNGKLKAFLVAATEAQKQKFDNPTADGPAESLADFLLRSPLRGLDIDFDRAWEEPRKVDLG